MPSTRGLIVDDHEMVAQGLSEVLGAEDEIDVVGRARTVRDTVVWGPPSRLAAPASSPPVATAG